MKKNYSMPTIILAKNKKSVRVKYTENKVEKKSKRIYEFLLLYSFISTLKTKKIITDFELKILQEEIKPLRKKLRTISKTTKIPSMKGIVDLVKNQANLQTMS